MLKNCAATRIEDMSTFVVPDGTLKALECNEKFYRSVDNRGPSWAVLYEKSFFPTTEMSIVALQGIDAPIVGFKTNSEHK